MGNTVFFNLRQSGTIGGSATFLETITTEHGTVDIKSPTGESFSVQLGDASGATVFEILDSASVQVFSITSDGVIDTPSQLILDSAANGFLFRDSGVAFFGLDTSSISFTAANDTNAADLYLASQTGGNASANGIAAGHGGDLIITIGSGGDSITAGAGNNTGGNGGVISLTAGNGGSALDGAVNTGGTAGTVTLTSGNGAGANSGGDITLTTGSSGTSGGTGGDIVFSLGGGFDGQGVLRMSGADEDVYWKMQGTGIFRIEDSGSAAAITLDHNGTNALISQTPGNLVVDNLAVRYATRSIAAGTAADSPTNVDAILQCATDGAQALTITLPEAADNLGLNYIFHFVTDGGQNVTINRTGADTIDDAADIGNTAITMEDANDYIMIVATQNDKWMVIKNIGCTLT